MKLTFNPECAMLRECAFFVIAEITHTGVPEPIRVSTAAQSYQTLPLAIARSIYDTVEYSETEQAVILAILTELNPLDRWNLNTILNLPTDAHVGFDDGETQVIVRVFAIIDTRDGVGKMLDKDFQPNSGVEGLVDNVLHTSRSVGNISFIGHTSPETFADVMWMSMLGGDATLLRLANPEMKDGDLPDMSPAGYPDVVQTVEFIYPSGVELFEETCKIWQDAGAEVIPTFNGVRVRITGEIGIIFNLIEATKKSFVGFKIVKD